ncbi:hypothetical protein H072_2021 [Dactylellina haptotyla CBS 200.50]|uniref:SUZ domain-containing protein n=1 Tax=Dactylellina haptotyla (strain CBS 200.50) TaxID=1284197 RepID=S8AMA1_DACHA|nr:hypothetical protein H072_2021 [Dactylellina haptotyla CBS 200.50]
MAKNGTGSGVNRVPDAWNDDDWGGALKQVINETTDKLEDLEKSPEPASGKPPLILAKKPAASSTPISADDVTTHMQNMKIWNAANEGGSFEIVGNAVQPIKTLYRPEMKILKRATNTNSPERDPNKPGSGTPKSDAESDVEVKKETPQEKMERERKEKEERYAKARERLFGPDNAVAIGGDSMEKNPSSNGKNSGTATPLGGKSSNQQNKITPSRKASPSSRQRRRERVDDDFVPRSAMVAGTVESYHLDQQLQAEAQMRDIQSRTHFAPNIPQPQYMGYPGQFATGPPSMPGSFGYNNQPPFPQQGQQQYNNSQNMNFPHRQPINTGTPPWNSSYSSPAPQPHPHQFNQFQGQGQNQTHYQTQQQQQQQSQQISPPNYQTPYVTPFSQVGTNNIPNQNLPQHQHQHQQQQPQGLYDPNYSQKPPGHLQFYNQNGPPSQFPVREPKAPDGTGRGGFGFATRGGGGGMGSGMMPHHSQLPQGRGFPPPMFPSNNNQPNPQGGQSGGFNSPAAAAPWGVTNPIGSQRPGQIWGSMPNGNGMMNGEQSFHGQQPLMSSAYSGLGQNNVWGNPGTWNNGGGPGGAGRGKR